MSELAFCPSSMCGSVQWYMNRSTMTAALSAITLRQLGEHFSLHYSRVSRIVRQPRDLEAKGKL